MARTRGSRNRRTGAPRCTLVLRLHWPWGTTGPGRGLRRWRRDVSCNPAGNFEVLLIAQIVYGSPPLPVSDPWDRQPQSRPQSETRKSSQRPMLNRRRQDVFNREGRAVRLTKGTFVLAVVAAVWASGGLAQAPSTDLTLFGRVDLGLVAIDDGTRSSTRVDSGRYTESVGACGAPRISAAAGPRSSTWRALFG